MLVDDHEIITAGLRVVLQAEHDIAVVGKASGVKQAVRMATELKPDVVLMDVKLADGSGIDATEQIKVLKGVASGLSDKEIASKLFLSEPTVKSHLRSVYQKLRIHNRAQAAAYAVKNGLMN